jgi:hypothetical protein
MCQLYKDYDNVTDLREGGKVAKERQAKSLNDGRARKVAGKWLLDWEREKYGTRIKAAFKPLPVMFMEEWELIQNMTEMT